MLLSKKKWVIAVILVAVLAVIGGAALQSRQLCPENQFGIKEGDPFYLTHLYNVNGVVGAEKMQFTPKERRTIMKFLASLEHKKSLALPTETIYGVPVRLVVPEEDGSRTDFSFNEDIRLGRYDQNGKLLSLDSYTCSKRARSNVCKILGITWE
ncbi:hypothetical protein Ami103574_11595 [Aminipila butyrica]|uniref:Uncharacterized protein n=1 Tax=Aminipila butyrica TaxID=433296 RepID=A0A858BZ01_9FIRM|nr:hypothetical protein [Aminipila butyrica]QIB69924.1 hypothetical protein Ami103574_11595 [Aminipila butyrica]